MDNATLIHTFAESVVSGTPVLLANSELRLEPIGETLQLLSKTEGMIASACLSDEPVAVSLRDVSQHWASLHKALLNQQFLPVQPSSLGGYYLYEAASIPEGYNIHFSDGLVLLQAWWQYRQNQDGSGLLGILLWHRRAWHPIRDIRCENSLLQVATWGSEIIVQPSARTAWIIKAEAEVEGTTETVVPGGNAHGEVSVSSSSKCIGNYLVEAGLLSSAQVEVVLSDQSATGMRFGEIVVSRGWLKEQTIEYLMTNLILPQQVGQASVTSPTPSPEPSPLPDLPVRTPRKKEVATGSIHERETLVISSPFEDLA